MLIIDRKLVLPEETLFSMKMSVSSFHLTRSAQEDGGMEGGCMWAGVVMRIAGSVPPIRRGPDYGQR